MAGGDEIIGGAAGSGSGELRRAFAAMLLIGAGTNVYDAFSAVMSSPWSTEKFTAGPEEARMAREYVRHAVVISWVHALAGALITRGKLWVWPILGAAGVTGYMVWLYRRAIGRGVSGAGMSAAVSTAATNGGVTDGLHLRRL